MMRARDCRGMTLVETLVSMTILVLMLSGIATLLIHNSRINKSQQMTVEMQDNARTCLSMVVQKLRGTGWDPMNTGIVTVNLDPDPSDNVSEIEILADLDEDGATTGANEQILIRHTGNQVLWRTSAAGTLRILADNISNDADGDGTPEPMFVPDSTTDPTRVVVQVTARSAAVDPVTGAFLRYTLRSDVALRRSL